jgi:hypothetical protein
MLPSTRLLCPLCSPSVVAANLTKGRPPFKVLLYPGTKFRVVGSMDMGSGLFMVQLQQVDTPVALFQ